MHFSDFKEELAYSNTLNCRVDTKALASDANGDSVALLLPTDEKKCVAFFCHGQEKKAK